MNLRRTHKIRIYPTPEQVLFLQDCAFAARTAWNFALDYLIKSNTQVINVWRSLTSEQRLELPPAGKKAAEAWSSHTDDERLRRVPTNWDVLPARAAWTQYRKTETTHPGVLASLGVYSLICGTVIRDDMGATLSAYFKKDTSERCPRAVRGKKCWCMAFPSRVWAGHPRFRSARDGASIPLQGCDRSGNNANFSVDGKFFVVREHRIPMSVELRFGGRAASARITEDKGEWFVSISCEFDVPDPELPTGSPIGFDLGVRDTATRSDGKRVNLTHGKCPECEGAGCGTCWDTGVVRERKQLEEKAARLQSIRDGKGQRIPCPSCGGSKAGEDGMACPSCGGTGDRLEFRTILCGNCGGSGTGDRRNGTCRTCKGFGKVRSKHVEKLEQKIRDVQSRAANLRKERVQQLTTQIARERRSLIAFEDVDLAKLRKDSAQRGRKNSEGKRARGFQKAFSDASPGEFRRILGYKAQAEGTRVVKVPAAYTTRTCSGCGTVEAKIDLSVREWICSECWQMHDRDVNAAQVVLQRALAGSIVEKVVMRVKKVTRAKTVPLETEELQQFPVPEGSENRPAQVDYKRPTSVWREPLETASACMRERGGISVSPRNG